MQVSIAQRSTEWIDGERLGRGSLVASSRNKKRRLSTIQEKKLGNKMTKRLSKFGTYNNDFNHCKKNTFSFLYRGLNHC